MLNVDEVYRSSSQPFIRPLLSGVQGNGNLAGRGLNESLIAFCMKKGTQKGAFSYRSVCHGDSNQDRILLLFYKKNNSSIYCQRRGYDPGKVRRTHCERGAPSPKDKFNAIYSKRR